MPFESPLIQVRLVRRYRRFLADLEFPMARPIRSIARIPAPCWVATGLATVRG